MQQFDGDELERLAIALMFEAAAREVSRSKTHDPIEAGVAVGILMAAANQVRQFTHVLILNDLRLDFEATVTHMMNDTYVEWRQIRGTC